jgi:hypothetical protein
MASGEPKMNSSCRIERHLGLKKSCELSPQVRCNVERRYTPSRNILPPVQEHLPSLGAGLILFTTHVPPPHPPHSGSCPWSWRSASSVRDLCALTRTARTPRPDVDTGQPIDPPSPTSPRHFTSSLHLIPRAHFLPRRIRASPMLRQRKQQPLDNQQAGTAPAPSTSPKSPVSDAPDAAAMTWASQNRWVVLAIASGGCAAFNGVFAKLYVFREPPLDITMLTSNQHNHRAHLDNLKGHLLRPRPQRHRGGL